MLQVLYNSLLLLRGHFKWTQNISERVLLKKKDDAIHYLTSLSWVVEAPVSLSILSL